MRTLSGCLAVALLLSVAKAQDAPPVVQKTGTYFIVHVHGGDEALASQALAAVEPVFRRAAATFGAPEAPPPKPPLDVHLYRTIAGYVAADRQLTGGNFERNLAMFHWDSKSAHVAVQPPVADEVLREFGLPALTVEMLAWESTHVVRAHLHDNFRQHPLWYLDGLASSTARAVREELRPLGHQDFGPTTGADFTIVQNLAREQRLPKASAIVAGEGANLEFSTKYAVHAAFFRFLQSDGQKSKLPKLAQVVRGTGGGDGYPAAVQKGVLAVLGGSVDRDFAAFVAKAQPKWEEVFRCLDPSGTQWLQIAFPNRNAVCWSTAPVKGGRLAARGTLRILPGGRQQLNFLFARDAQLGFYSVAFTADYGVNVFRFDPAIDDFTAVGRAEAKNLLAVGVATPFAVLASGKELVVELGGTRFPFTLPVDLPKEIRWGLGAQNGPQDAATGSAGVWGDLVVDGKKR